MALLYTKSEAKQWAKKNFRGLEVPIFPSFSPDMMELDEEGIRYDVNQIIANGFASVLVAGEACGMSFEERKKFVEIVNDEVKGRIHVSVSVIMDTVEQNVELLKCHEKAGGTLAMVGHPMMYDPLSVEEMFRMYKYMCDSTNLAIQFYPARLKVKRYHESGWPMSLLPRIADIPNVVAMKLPGGSSIPFVAQCFQLAGDKILVADPETDKWFETVPKNGQQWAGAGPFYALQTPEDKSCVRMFNLLLEGKLEEALEINWKLKPFTDQAASILSQVSYPETGIVCSMADKYCFWCTGGNGGILRQPVSRLFDYQKKTFKNALKAIGITPSENEEEFFVGRMNYAKGARLKRY
jgi:4-hydroxy-tetrahydrodipicolinate synthase